MSSQLPAAKKPLKRASCDVINDDFINFSRISENNNKILYSNLKRYLMQALGFARQQPSSSVEWMNPIFLIS
jgi:hypothetical protein